MENDFNECQIDDQRYENNIEKWLDKGNKGPFEEKEYWCEGCGWDFDSDELEWLNDQALCPNCGKFIEL